MDKVVKTWMIIGAIFAIPLLFAIMILETASYSNDDGICPYHKLGNQMQIGGDKTICDGRLERGIPDGEIRGGVTCIDGVYYQTNYRCITGTLGFFESEGSPIIFLWLFLLAEFYGIIFGSLMGFIASKLLATFK